jgi:hypothetical protein
MVLLPTSQAVPVWSTDAGNRVRLIGNHAVLLEVSVSLSHKVLLCGSYFHSIGAGSYVLASRGLRFGIGGLAPYWSLPRLAVERAALDHLGGSGRRVVGWLTFWLGDLSLDDLLRLGVGVERLASALGGRRRRASGTQQSQARPHACSGLR